MLLAAPGDVLFRDDFNRGNIGPWVASNNSRAGILNSAQGSQSPTRGAYTRRGTVTLTSPAFNAAVPAAEVSVWVRRGSDSFSEEPDGGEDLVFEYRRANGTWAALQSYAGGETPGEIFLTRVLLPADALHGSLALRFRQLSGSGGNYDWWHIDDVEVIESGPTTPFGVGQCDDFSNGLGTNWSINASGGAAGVSNAAFQSPTLALELNAGPVSVTSGALDATASGFSEISLWIQRGSDTFSERPDGNESLVIEYLNDSGSWIGLETFTGAGSAGQIFTRAYPVPADARHAAFRLRFRQLDGSGPGYDFWHIDDVCLDVAPVPALQITKSVQTLSDPVNGTSNPKAIPGSRLRYVINVSNAGAGTTDTDSLVIQEIVPTGTALFVQSGGSDPIVFQDGGVPSGLTYNYSADVTFSSQPGGVAPYDYTPVPDAQGFDPLVTGLQVSPSGAMNAEAGGSIPSFSLQLDVRLQ